MKTLTKTISLSLSLLILVCAVISFEASADSVMEVPRITFITENNNGISLKKSDGYVNAEVTVDDVDGSSFSESVVMKVRGNSTAFDSISKKSYNFKFSKKKNLLNLGNGKKWALISNVYDPTLARNYVALSLAEKLGIQYTSAFKVVEVVVDGSFRGCYLLVEPVGTGKDRVDIDTESNSGKKDFMIELESSRQEDDVKYFTSNGLRFAMSEPDTPTDEQVVYAQLTIDDVINTIKNGTKDDIENKIDTESFAKFYLLNEYLKTVDIGFSSVFFYYKDGRLYAGPPWDFDLSSGNVNKDYSSWYASSYKTDGLFVKNYNFFKWLCEKPWFNDLVKTELCVHYNYINSIAAEGGVIDSFYNTYRNDINRNFNKNCWKVNAYYVNVMKKPLDTYQENYDYFVNWCRERSDWLINYFDAEPILNPKYERLIKNTFTPDAVDGNVAGFNFSADIKYKGLELLGLQLKSDNTNSVRFFSVISSEVLEKSSDYGYVVCDTDKDTNESKESIDELTLENGDKYSCFKTANKITGAYGNPDVKTDYKYVTLAINNIEDDKTIAARFYAVIDGIVCYAEYNDSAGTVSGGCAAKISALK